VIVLGIRAHEISTSLSPAALHLALGTGKRCRRHNPNTAQGTPSSQAHQGVRVPVVSPGLAWRIKPTHISADLPGPQGCSCGMRTYLYFPVFHRLHVECLARHSSMSRRSASSSCPCLCLLARLDSQRDICDSATGLRTQPYRGQLPALCHIAAGELVTRVRVITVARWNPAGGHDGQDLRVLSSHGQL
jgi:hypothetical protein